MITRRELRRLAARKSGTRGQGERVTRRPPASKPAVIPKISPSPPHLVTPSREVPDLQGRVKECRVFHDALTIQRLGFVGPLGFPNSIKVDISFRETVSLPLVIHLMETLYYEPFPVTTMQLEEMVAEKLRAALMRKAPRDYFDLWLVVQEATIDTTLLPDLLKAKMETVGLAYDPALLWRELDTLERLWQDDLRELMPQVPEFSSMIEELRDGLPALLR